MASLLLTAVLLPLIGALLLGGDRLAVRRYALTTTVLVLALAAVLVAGYSGGPETADGVFAQTDIPWLGEQTPIDIRFHVALDGLSLWLFALTALLMVVSVLVSWEAIDTQESLFYRLLLILETGMLGVFVARDIILFYVFFEFTLIPLFFLIGIWGSEERRYAAVKFFLFTLSGSVLTFLGLLAIVYYYSPPGRMTFSIPELTVQAELSLQAPFQRIDPWVQWWIFWALFAGFAIKVPLFPLHTWLPLAHVQAPTAGSVLLAGVLLKIGTYGFLRFSLPLLPEASAAAMPWLLWLSVAGIIYGALVALAQTDIKRLVAYSSISHLGFCMLGLFAINRLGVQGSVLQMVNHGLSTGGLFAMVGMMYERYHTRQIAELGGLARQTPVLAFFFVFLALSSLGLPGLNGFVGELLILIGMFQRGWADAPPAWAAQFRVIAVLSTTGVVLAAWYLLHLIERVFFGPLRQPRRAEHGPPVRDLSVREIMALTPLAVMIIWIGVWPQFFLERMAPTLDRLTAPAMAAVEQQGSAACGFALEPNPKPPIPNPQSQAPNPPPTTR